MPKQSGDRRPATAIVITNGQYAMGNAVDVEVFHSLPQNVLGDIGWLLDRMSETLKLREDGDEGTLIIPEIHGELLWTAEVLKLADEAGWQSTYDGQSGWRTFNPLKAGKLNRDVALHVGLLPSIDQSKNPLFDVRDTDAGRICRALTAYQAATDTPYRATPGVSGCASIRRRAAAAATFRGSQGRSTGQPYWLWDAHPGHMRGLGEATWSRPVPDDPPPYVVQLDVRGQYLAGASAAELAWSPLDHAGPQGFDPTMAGYWLVDFDAAHAALSRLIGHRDHPSILSWVTPYDVREDPRDPKSRVVGHVLPLTTPAMTYLWSLGVRPDIVDSWTLGATGRYLRPWAERLRDALASYTDNPPPPARVDAGRLTATLKATYAETVGMMARPGGTVYRPDWRDTVIDVSTCNLWRKIDKAEAVTGQSPLRVFHDAVFYLSDTPEPSPELLDALDATRPDASGHIPYKVGKLRHVGTKTTAEYTAARTRRRNQRPARPARKGNQ